MSRSSQFEIFVDKKNNAIKEQFKQEKKKKKRTQPSTNITTKKKAKSPAREQASKPAATPVRGNSFKKQENKDRQLPSPPEISSIKAVDLMPLNKYVAHSGVYAREAVLLIRKEKYL
jgi:hypothetical protein